MSPVLRRAIIVCALGYFIDVFDIQLFAILRVDSLTDLGVAPKDLPSVGGSLLNLQMLGMLLGSFLWGALGDRYGRLKALYGSIFIYSLGTLACSFVHQVGLYGALRFVTGFGLAGETGAAITLIAELMSREKRGWGITIIAGFGTFGPALAVLLSWFLPWRLTYVAAGAIGLGLLAARLGLVESGLFQKLEPHRMRGAWRFLFSRQQAFVFLRCLGIGLPLIYALSLLNFFSLELARAVLAPGEAFDQKICLLLFYLGFGCGDMLSGALSQLWRSRRKTMAAFLTLGAGTGGVYLVLGEQVLFSAPTLYAIYGVLGLATGCWVLFTAIAAEHFGTNIRATATIVSSNLLRGITIPMVILFQNLRDVMPITTAAALIGGVLYAIAFASLRRLRETHGLDLDY